MKIMVENPPYAESNAELCCAECDELLLDAGEAIELDEFVRIAQAHGYGCKKRPIVSEGLFHGACGGALVHYEGNPEKHRCSSCNRTVPRAEQSEHRFVFPSVDAQKQAVEDRAACVCGWRSPSLAINETVARGEWNRHPKRALPESGWRAN